VLKAFPKEVVVSFLERTAAYCQLNELNPRVGVPASFNNKYLGIKPFTEVYLLDLIAWAEAGLAGTVR